MRGRSAPPALLLGIVILGGFLIHFVTAGIADPPLVQAARAGDLALVTQLLDDGADPNAHDRNRNTALIFAARDGRLKIATLLIARGADVDWLDGENVTPLILASHKNHIALVRLLLARRADRTVRDKWARTALDYALRRGENDPIASLLNRP